MRFLRKFLANQSGMSAIEYGLALALVSLAVVGAVNATGVKLWGLLNEVGDSLG